MKTNRPVLLAAGLVSVALLGVALYLQHVQNMLPCPMCVLQRYAFAAVALICFIFAFLPRAALKTGALLAASAALVGAAIAGRHLWIKAHPATSCGIDPLETSLNTIPTAKLLPFLFKAEGLCTADYAPVLGLSIPLWAFIWFVVLAVVLLWAAFKRKKEVLWFR